MTNCIWELQKAVFAALDGDGTLSGMVTGVYSHVSEDTAFPYVKFADGREQDWSTKTSEGISAVVNLEVYSRERGFKECLDIVEEVKRILNGASLSMTGCSMVDMKFLETDVRQLGDGLTWRGVVGFRSLVESS